MPHLSISDPSHHVTEAIGHMYDDEYDTKRDSKRLSYIPSPVGESISTLPPSLAASENPTSPQSIQVQNHLNRINSRKPNGKPPHLSIETKTSDRDADARSPGSGRSTPDTATTSFPLNDIDYESDPAAITQELSNLAAIRRMSMDFGSTGDPDLPGYGSDMPSMAPSPSADENDASRLFWVPARLHPELAPREFKSFLDSKADHIKRRSGDSSSLSPERAGSTGGLQRRKSTLSREIDNSSDFTDGAELLERKRSQNAEGTIRESLGPNLHELETLVDDSPKTDRDSTGVANGVQDLNLGDEDKPILPPAPPGASLRRSTRTRYKKGSFKKGEKMPFSRRGTKGAEDHESVSPIVTSGQQPILGLTRVSTDPSSGTKRPQQLSDPPQRKPSSESFDSISENKSEESTDTGNRSSAPPQMRKWHSRISSNGRSTLQIPPSEQKIPEIVETPPASPTDRQKSKRDRDSRSPSPKISPGREPVSGKRTARTRPNKESSASLNEFANQPQPLPGNSTRTDSLSFIPTFSEEKKDSKKSKEKEKKETEGGRKSSWHWLLGTEDKDKDKDKEKKKDKDGDSKKTKSKSADKSHDNARLDILQTSSETPRGRESLVFDRLDPKLEEERRKDNARRTSGESKKEKESGLFSSIFGGGKKKHSGDAQHKKQLSRNLSPDPPVRELRPDLDYPWTRFPILEERAIYRMAHIKLANPRRALHSQVLLSNFMYSYLAKVQQMQPQMMSASQQKKDQPEEYLQYQRYQQVGPLSSRPRQD